MKAYILFYFHVPGLGGSVRAWRDKIKEQY